MSMLNGSTFIAIPDGWKRSERARSSFANGCTLRTTAARCMSARRRQTPQMRILATLLRLPVIGTVANLAYNVFAAGLYRWNRWHGRW